MKFNRRILTSILLVAALAVGIGVLFKVYLPSSPIVAEEAEVKLSRDLSEVSASSFTQTSPFRATISINLKDTQGNPLNCQSPAPKAVAVEALPIQSFKALETQVETVSSSADCKSNWVLGVETQKAASLPILIKVLDEKGEIFTLEEAQIGFSQTF